MSNTLERLARRKRATEVSLAAPSAPGRTSETTHADSPSESASGPSTGVDLREAIEGARDWGELEAVLQDVNRAYHAGALAAEDVETLARRAGERSRQLPEKLTKANKS